MPYITVDVNLSDFSDEEILEEMFSRNLSDKLDSEEIELIEKIWQLRRSGLDYQKQLDELIYTVLGKLV